MEIKYGAEVIDKNGRFLGNVNHLMRDTWTGEITKFVVYGEGSNKDLYFSPKDVVEVINNKVKVDISSDE